MKFSRRALTLSGLSISALAIVIAACSDSDDALLPKPPTGPDGPAVPAGEIAIACKATVKDQTLLCRTGRVSGGNGASFDAIYYGGQNLYVTLTGTNVDYTDPSGATGDVGDWTADVTVTNLIPQAIGTSDGTTLDPAGVRIGFMVQPTANVGSGPITIDNSDGTDIFSAGVEPFYQYDQIIQPNATSAAKTWHFKVPDTVESFQFMMEMKSPVQHPEGWVDFTPDTTVLVPGQFDTLTTVVRNPVGVPVGTPVTYGTTNASVVVIDQEIDGNTIRIQAVGAGTANITGTAPVPPNGPQNGHAVVIVTAPPVVTPDSIDAVGNVVMSLPAGTLTDNITNEMSETATIVPEADKATAAGGTITLNADGSFTYLTAAGYTGRDSVYFQVTDGYFTDSAYLKIKAPTRVWYVQPGAVAAGDGRQTSPFNTIAAVEAVSSANESIYVLAGGATSPADEGITLKDGQSLTGQDLTAPVTVSLNGQAVTLLATGASPRVARTTAGATVTLPVGGSNTIQGLRIGSTNGAGILSGASFAALNLSRATVNAAGGPALDLTSGALTATLDSLGSSGSATTGVDLSGVTGTLTAAAGSIDQVFAVDGGSVAVTYSGNLSENTAAAALVSVTGGHTGSLTFDTGTLSATDGTGLQFSDADGTYAFNGTTTLNGGDAGVDIVAGSDGTFTFGAGTSITGPSGTAFALDAGTASVTFSGSITQNNQASLVAITGGHATGTVAFQTGTLAATQATGSGVSLLEFNDADGTYNFTGTATLAGGDVGVDIDNGSAGTFAFGANVDVTSPGGTGVMVYGSTANVTFDGDVTQANNAVLVNVGEQTGGTVTFQNGTLSATNGTGIQLSNADGTVNFNGTTTLNGGDAGVDIVSGSAGTITFAAGTTITNPTGTALNVLDSEPVLDFAGTISVNGSRPVAVDAASPCGTITVSGNLTSTGLGILVQDCTAGSVSFTGATKSLATGANQGVTLTNNNGAAINFQGGGLAISTTSATGFGATGGGTIQVTGANNTVASTTGTAVSLSGVESGTSGITFRSVDANGAANGIVLANITGNGFQVTGDGSNNGSGGTIQNTTGHAVSLNTVVTTTLEFLNVTGAGASGNAGIFGSSFGTLNVNNVSLGATGGPALSLATGTLNGDFNSVSSASSATNGVILNTVGGSVTIGGGSITGATNTAFAVTGGTVGLTYQGGITQANNAALVSVAGGHDTGTITFNTGTLSATNGTGLQFDNADGVYSFNGTTTLNGGDAGIDLLNGSDGDFTFGTGVSITNPSGAGFFTSGSAPNVTYSGSLSKNSAGWLVDTFNQSGGTITFQTGNLSATGTSTGITFNNADGTVNFNGPTALSGGTARINVQGGSSGAINFASGTSVSGPPSGFGALHVTNGGASADIDYAGTLAGNPGRPAHIEGVSGGSVTVTGAVTSTGQGLLIQNNSGGAFTFSNATKTLNTGSNAAVTLSGNSGSASVLFSGGNLDIDTNGAANAFTASGGGTVVVTGANNSINAVNGTALRIDGPDIGASGLTFQRIDSSNGANGIFLNNTGSTNGLLVTGNGGVCTVATPTCTGGTIQGASGDGVSLASATNVFLNFVRVQTAGGSGVAGNSVTGFRLKSSLVNNNGNAAGEAGLEFDNLFGTDSILSSTITGSAEDNVVVRNTSGTLDSLVVLSSTISSNSAIGNDGILVTASNAANATVRVRNSTFTANKGDHFQATASNTADLTVVLFQNTLTGGHASALGQGITLTNGLTHSGTFTYDINDNDILNGPISNAITVAQDGTTGAVMQGRIRNNTIGTSGSSLSCSTQGNGIKVDLSNRGTHTTAVTGNVVRQCFDRGIFFDAGDGTNATFNITATGNTVAELVHANSRDGMRIEAGAFDPNFLGSTDSFNVCAVVGGAAAADKNTLMAGPGGGNPLRARLRFNSRMNMPGYAGPADNGGSQVEAYLTARNTLTGSASATTALGNPFGYGNAASCPTPP